MLKLEYEKKYKYFNKTNYQFLDILCKIILDFCYLLITNCFYMLGCGQ